mmetsp:Transcript_21829/g.46154  ORF Transcript_21829/g.46154 Transcript_21829/m.46154 type:complete len:235 (-) Transcript_21829:663-1367(-)|eukprot:3957149-Pleurochrysis_carterae.AAC.1
MMTSTEKHVTSTHIRLGCFLAKPGMLLLLGLQLVCAQYTSKDTSMAMRWWCDPSGGNMQDSMLCKRWSMTEAIARLVEPDQKNEQVKKLQEAILRGEIEAQGLDATNPDRHRMMEAWCSSADEEGNKNKKPICARAQAHKDFVQRRELLMKFWCEEQGQKGSAKCRQMEYGQRMHATTSGAERLKLATEFKTGRDTAPADLEAETKQMMHAICASPHGKTPLFMPTCSRSHLEL